MTLAGCADDNADESPSTTSSSSSPTGNWDEDHALTEAEQAIAQLDERDVDKPLDANEASDWATLQYVQTYNQEIKVLHDKQVTQKGTVSTKSVHFKDLDPKGADGPDLTVSACSVSPVATIRRWTRS